MEIENQSLGLAWMFSSWSVLDPRWRTVPSFEYAFFQLWQLNAVFLAALFNQQTLYDRQLAVRMDKWVDPILQDIPKRMPSGLKSLGVGFGAAGYPLLNIAQISSECRFTW